MTMNKSSKFGETIYPILQKYKVSFPVLSDFWDFEEEELKAQLDTPISELDEDIIPRCLMNTGLSPLLEGVLDNFALLSVRNTGILEPASCNLEPTRADKPFLIELFLGLFSCLDEESQRGFVWNYIYKSIDDRPWKSKVDKLINLHHSWAKKVYWNWNEHNEEHPEFEFEDLDPQALVAVIDQVEDPDILDCLTTSPVELILRDLAIFLDLTFSPPDDVGNLEELVNPLLAHFHGKKLASSDTLLKLILSPFLKVDGLNKSQVDQDDTDAVGDLFKLFKQFPYPDITPPSFAELLNMGKNPAPYAREIVEQTIQAAVDYEKWPTDISLDNTTAWLYIFDGNYDRYITNVIYDRWPARDTAKTLGHRSMAIPIFNNSVKFLSLSSADPSLQRLAAQPAEVFRTQPKSISIKIPRGNEAKAYAVVWGPEVDTRLFLGQLHVKDEHESRPLWNIEGKRYRLWLYVINEKYSATVDRIAKAIADMHHRVRRDGCTIHMTHIPRLEYFEMINL